MSGVTKVEIAESADELKEQMNKQFKAREKGRLQALYLLKSGKCQQIIEIAEILGRSRSTIHRWFHIYEQGGLAQLIGAGKKPGRKRLIPNWASAKLERRLQQPRGFKSYLEIQQWLESECGIKVRYHVVHELVRYRLGAKRKRPRPVRQNQDHEAVEDFPERLTEDLLLLVANFSSTSKIRYWCEDESRFGLKTIERSKITAKGVQPIGMSQWIFKTIWLYGIVEPITGEYVFWEFSHLDSICFEAFLDSFSQQYPDEIHIIQLDNSGAHTASQIEIPDNIKLLFQPPYSPELNPIERLWKFLKDQLAWQLWTDLDELTSEIEFHIRQLTKPIVASVTGWDSILDALCVSGIF
jgi:transposase